MPEPSASAYPAALDSTTTLFGDAVNLTRLTLDTGLDNSTTTVSVTESIASINLPCYILIDAELIYVTASGSGDFTSCVRAAGGTTASEHLTGAYVYVVYAANYHNQVKRALIAIETELGVAPKTID